MDSIICMNCESRLASQSLSRSEHKPFVFRLSRHSPLSGYNNALRVLLIGISFRHYAEALITHTRFCQKRAISCGSLTQELSDGQSVGFSARTTALASRLRDLNGDRHYYLVNASLNCLIG